MGSGYASVLLQRPGEDARMGQAMEIRTQDWTSSDEIQTAEVRTLLGPGEARHTLKRAAAASC